VPRAAFRLRANLTPKHGHTHAGQQKPCPRRLNKDRKSLVYNIIEWASLAASNPNYHLLHLVKFEQVVRSSHDCLSPTSPFRLVGLQMHNLNLCTFAIDSHVVPEPRQNQVYQLLSETVFEARSLTFQGRGEVGPATAEFQVSGFTRRAFAEYHLLLRRCTSLYSTSFIYQGLSIGW